MRGLEEAAAGGVGTLALPWARGVEVQGSRERGHPDFCTEGLEHRSCSLDYRSLRRADLGKDILVPVGLRHQLSLRRHRPESGGWYLPPHPTPGSQPVALRAPSARPGLWVTSKLKGLPTRG